MDRFMNALKAQASTLDHALGQPRFATVCSVNPAAFTARVMLQPEGVLTGWLPVLSPCVGAGWGIACPPSPGDQVFVLSQEGDAEHGVVVGRAFSDSQPTPAAPHGELWLVHKSGAFIKLQNDGTIQMNGDVHVNGDVFDRHGSLDRLRQHYDVHVHGSGPTPTPQD